MIARLLLATCLFLAPAAAWANTYAHIVAGAVSGALYTPLPGRTVATDFPPDFVWVDVTNTVPQPGTGWSYNAGTGVFAQPANVVPAVGAAATPVYTINGVAPDASGNVAGLATTATVASLAANMPVPSTAVPPSPTPAGAAGSGQTYIPANASPPSLTRAASATTAADGTFSVTWSVPFVSASPLVNAVAINTGSQPVICNITSRGAATVTGKCWVLTPQTLTLANVTAGVTLSPSGPSAAGISVMIAAREPAS